MTVKNAIWNRRIDAPGNLFDLAAKRSSTPGAVPSTPEAASAFPLKFDVQILIPCSEAWYLVAYCHERDREVMLGLNQLDPSSFIEEPPAVMERALDL